MLKGEFAALKARQVANTSVERIPRHRLDHPTALDGPQRWDTWLPLMKAKLRIDCEAIGDKEAQFFYVFGNLDSKIQALVLPQLHAAEQTGYNPQSIIDQLSRIYEDPNKVEKATNKLSRIKQNNDTFMVYLSRFERLIFEAQAHEWPDAAKIAALHASLDFAIYQKLNTQLTLPSKYDDFIKILQHLSAGTSFNTAAGNGHGY